MKPIPLQPNLPTPTNCFGKPVPASQWYVCPNCKKESPLTKEWVGLMDDEIDLLITLHAPPIHPDFKDDDDFIELVESIEAKLKEKNHAT